MLYQFVSIGKSRLFYPYNFVIKMCSYFQRDLRWGQLKASSTCRGQQLKPFVTRSLKRRACEKPFKSNRFRRSCCNLQAAPFWKLLLTWITAFFTLYFYFSMLTPKIDQFGSHLFFLRKRKRTRLTCIGHQHRNLQKKLGLHYLKLFFFVMICPPIFVAIILGKRPH